MLRRLVAFAIFLVWSAGCAGPAPISAPFVPTRDPNVTVFQPDHQTQWDQFRLGGGLNVVVADSRLPSAPAWRFSGARKGTSSSPVVEGETILVPSNDRHLYAISASNGTLAWAWQADNELMSSPVYQDNLIVVGAGNSNCLILDPPKICLMGMGHNHLDALDSHSGKQVWRYELTGTGMPSPAINNGSLIHFDGSGVLQSIDVRTARFQWRHLLYSIGTMSNVLLDGRGDVFISGLYPNAVYAFRATDGTMLWQHRLSDRFNAVADCPLAFAGNRVVTMYLAPGRDSDRYVQVGVRARQHVYALDARTGTLLWDTLVPNVVGIAPANNESAVPLVVGTTVYDGSAVAPVVTAFDLRSGRVKWQLRVSGPVKGGLVERDGALYFGDLHGTLWAVNASTGLVLGSVKTDLSFNVGSPIIVNDSIVIGSQEGPVIAVPLADIRQSRSVDGLTVARSRVGFFISLAILLAAITVITFLSARRPKRSGPKPTRTT
jgi:outer membrane protein assembly factor BamB